MSVPSSLLSATRASFPASLPSSETPFYWEGPARGQGVSEAGLAPVVPAQPPGTRGPSAPSPAGNVKVGMGQQEQFSGLGRGWAVYRLLGCSAALLRLRAGQGVRAAGTPKFST